jgi:hypothetical protein
VAAGDIGDPVIFLIACDDLPSADEGAGDAARDNDMAGGSGAIGDGAREPLRETLIVALDCRRDELP